MGGGRYSSHLAPQDEPTISAFRERLRYWVIVEMAAREAHLAERDGYFAPPFRDHRTQSETGPDYQRRIKN